MKRHVLLKIIYFINYCFLLSISLASASGLTVVYPSGDDIYLFKGYSYNITWNYISGSGANVKIELYKSSSFNRTIISSTANDGFYTWTVPSSQEAGWDFKLKISSTTNQAYYDYSDYYFAIGPTDTVKTPRNTTVPSCWILEELSSEEIQNSNAYWDWWCSNNGNGNCIRIGSASGTYNCHSFAWYKTEGGSSNVWIGFDTSTAENTYWNDGSYYKVNSSTSAEKISYGECPSGDSDDCDHSAITTNSAGWIGTKYSGWLESKWGPAPLMKHLPSMCPYNSTQISYYKRNTFEPNDSFSTAKVISINTSYEELIYPQSDADYFKVPLTPPGTVTINLTSLPANYNIYFYNPSQSLLASSTQSGTTNEQIVYSNFSMSGYYYVKVIGYSGAKHATDTYGLSIAWQGLSIPTIITFSINNGASSTTSRTVTLNNSCTGNPTYYMASQSSTFSGASWYSYSIWPSFTLSSGNGTKTVYFKVKNSAGESSTRSDTITLNEVTLPVVSTFSINNGASSTTNRTVTLNNSCTGSPTYYMASQSSTFSGASWLTYSTTPSFTLSSGNGTKTVYLKVKNSSGESSSKSDTITLAVPYIASPTSTTNGSGNLGSSNLLKMQITISNGKIGYFSVKKTDGSNFTSSGTMYLKVGGHEHSSFTRSTKAVTPGMNIINFNADYFDNYPFDSYPKKYYVRYEVTNSSGYHWCGPISISLTSN